MTLDELLNLLPVIDSAGRNIRQKVLTCGATHLAVDECGEVYAWKGDPEPNEWGYCSCGEWIGDGKAKCILCVGDIPHPADSGHDWKELLIKLP